MEHHEFMSQLMIYILCVGLSSAVNYGAQEVCFVFWPHIVAAMLSGTVAGLVVKYILVKKYAFAFKTSDRKHEAKVFIIYGALGAASTALFWGIELGFHYFAPIEHGRQVGAIVGLVVSGYLKFVMDRDYVFVDTLSGSAPQTET